MTLNNHDDKEPTIKEIIDLILSNEIENAIKLSGIIGRDKLDELLYELKGIIDNKYLYRYSEKHIEYINYFLISVNNRRSARIDQVKSDGTDIFKPQNMKRDRQETIIKDNLSITTGRL